MIVRTVTELIEELKKLPPETVPISHEPPFDGIKLVPQTNGKLLIASLWDSSYSRATKATRAA